MSTSNDKQQALHAFNTGLTYNSRGWQVESDGVNSKLWSQSHNKPELVASVTDDILTMSDGHWRSLERQQLLNDILAVFGIPSRIINLSNCDWLILDNGGYGGYDSLSPWPSTFYRPCWHIPSGQLYIRYHGDNMLREPLDVDIVRQRESHI